MTPEQRLARMIEIRDAFRTLLQDDPRMLQLIADWLVLSEPILAGFAYPERILAVLSGPVTLDDFSEVVRGMLGKFEQVARFEVEQELGAYRRLASLVEGGLDLLPADVDPPPVGDIRKALAEVQRIELARRLAGGPS